MQSHIWTEEDMPNPVTLTGEGNCIAMQSIRKPAKEEPNDDAALFYAWPNGSCVVAVADGVGGAPLGNQASAVAMNCLREQLDKADPSRDLRPNIMDAIEQANAEVLLRQSGSATTLTVAEIREGVARLYQVGDSMAVIFGGRGLIKYRTISHSPVGYAVESGFLDDEDAMHHDERHFISNFVGSKEMRIEVGPAIRLAKRDAVLLGSDGLFDNLGLDEVVACALKGTAGARVSTLTARASERMNHEQPDQPCKPDDLTVLLWMPG